MSFLDKLNEEMNRLERSSGGGDFDKVTHPISTVKNELLYFNADKTEYMVRILPPTGDQFFSVGFQKMFFEATNASGKDIKTTMILPLHADTENNNLDKHVQKWMQNSNMPGRYSDTRPQTRYYLNVVLLQSAGDRKYYHELDENGQPVVRVIELPQTAYKEIINDLQDSNIIPPEGSGEYGMISAENAYPVKIWRTGQQLDTKYHVRTYEHPLGPLPEGWEANLEDLNYLATPTEEYNKEFVDYMIAVHEGYEAEFNEGRKNGEGGTPTTAPTQQPQQGSFGNPGQSDVTDEDMGHLPPKQAPTQPQGQGGFGNQPQQPQGGFGAPNQAQGGFQQAQAQPQQGNFGAVNQTPPTNNEPTPAPEPTQEQAPAPEAGGFGQPPQNDGLPNVDDLLKQVQDEVNK